MKENNYSFSESTKWGVAKKRQELSAIFMCFFGQQESGSALLEIGPGRGEFADLAIGLGCDYRAQEPSDGLRSELQSRGITVSPDALPDVAAEDGSLDAVYSYDVLEHLADYRTIMGYFENAYRALKPGGKLLSVAPNGETMGVLFYSYEYQHTYITTMSRIENMLTDCGFEIDSSRAFFSKFGLSSNWLSRVFDRLVANVMLALFRNPIAISLLRGICGRKTTFRVHKNLFDHVGVCARKPA